MSKKKTQSVEELIQNIDLSVAQGDTITHTSELKGKTYTLNQKKRVTFGVGNIWLTTKNPTITFDKDLSSQEESIIRKAIADGTLVEGSTVILPIDRDDKVLAEYWHLVKTYGLVPADTKSKSMIKFKSLLRLGSDRNWTAKEIAKYCIKQEQEYKNRENIIRLLNDLHKNADCPDSFLEDN
jgi:hypothetical protein